MSSHDNSAWSGQKAIVHNKLMHSLNGNTKTAKQRKRKSKNKQPSNHPKLGLVPEGEGGDFRLRLMSSGPIPAKIMKIANAIALPYEEDPIPWSDQYSKAKTAVAHPFYDINLPPFSLGAAFGLEGDQTLVFVMRNGLRAMVVFDNNTDSKTYQYDWFASQSSASVEVSLLLNVTTNIKMLYAVPDSSSQVMPHGPVLFPGESGKDSPSFFWVDSANGEATIHCAVDAIPAGAGLTITAYQWDVETIQPVGVLNLTHTGISGNITLPKSGYFGLKVMNTTATPGVTCNLTVYELSDSGFFWDHLCLPFFLNNFQSVEALRILSMGVRIGNRASTLNNQGSITCLQVPQDKDWTAIAANPGFLLGAQDHVELSAKTGAYGFAFPTNSDDMIMNTLYTSTINGSCCCFPLNNQSDYLAFFLQVTAADGQDFQLRPSWGVEYRTTDPWRDTHTNQNSTREYTIATDALKEIPQFYSNELHFGSIKNFLTKVLKGVATYGPKVMKGAEMISSLL